VGDLELTEKGDDGPDDRHIHGRDMEWLLACDWVVAEVSTPSLGVGYELGWATALEKPVLCLYRPAGGRHLSAMIAGSDQIQIRAYHSLAEAKIEIRDFFASRFETIKGKPS
jgi:nucleoside 2-deoxyribosyltransferase